MQKMHTGPGRKHLISRASSLLSLALLKHWVSKRLLT